ncbi:MAG TPA: enoyl-CoA hydratase/isomerase family protein [Chloroflexota bacterium]|nr:enoyl-CoA hydratase/isomerase family protein [Chloroflexota bacterium]
MSYQYLHLHVDDGVGYLTLDRPPLNVITIAMMREVQAALDALAAAPALRAVVLRGAGRAFSAGVDVGEHLGETVGPMLTEFHAIFERLEALAVPTVAVVHGVALGGGCELVGFCDFALAADTARLGFPEITLGVFPPVAAAVLPLRLGTRALLRLVLTGEVISAAEAQALGLVSTVVPEAELTAATEALLERLRGLSAAALHSARRALWAAEGGWRARLARAEQIYREELMATHDATEGLRAFLEKRAPEWQHA